MYGRAGSGGEGALIAARGSPLGLGTDIGGSVRIPAAFSGIVGFKPTPMRLTRSGISAPRLGNKSGQDSVVSVAGPMARSVEDCAAAMAVLLAKDSPVWRADPFAPRLEWDVAKLSASPSDLALLHYGTLTRVPTIH